MAIVPALNYNKNDHKYSAAAHRKDQKKTRKESSGRSARGGKEMLKCFKCIKKIDMGKTGLFAAGVLFGTAGIKVLSSKDAKKVYTGCTAAVLRAKECVMKTATVIQENAEDIYAEAQQINEERAQKEAELSVDELTEAVEAE